MTQFPSRFGPPCCGSPHSHLPQRFGESACCPPQQFPAPIPIPAHIYGVDLLPTEGSNNVVVSDGIYKALAHLHQIFSDAIGDFGLLGTTDKSNLVNAINELWTLLINVDSRTAWYDRIPAAPISLQYTATNGLVVFAGDTSSLNFYVVRNGVATLIPPSVSSLRTIYNFGATIEPGVMFRLQRSTDINPVMDSLVWQYTVPLSFGVITDYNDLLNLPSINGIVLEGNKTAAELGLATLANIAGFYTKPASGIPLTDLAAAVLDRLVPITSNNGDVLTFNSGVWSGAPPAPSGLQAVATKDSPTFRWTLAGDGTPSQPLTGEVRISLASDNALEAKPDGLFVDLSTFTPVVDYNSLLNRPSINGVTLAGNITLAALGISPDTMTRVYTSPSSNVTWTGNGTSPMPLQAIIKVSPTPGNALVNYADGLFVDINTGGVNDYMLLSSRPSINGIILVPGLTAAALGIHVDTNVQNSNSIQLTGIGSTAQPVVANLRLDPAPTNRITVSPTGVKVDPEPLDSNPENKLERTPDGLFVAPVDMTGVLFYDKTQTLTTTQQDRVLSNIGFGTNATSHDYRAVFLGALA